METPQNNNVWDYVATVGAVMKSHQLSLILDVVNPLISILCAELMFHIIFIDLIPAARLNKSCQLSASLMVIDFFARFCLCFPFDKFVVVDPESFMHGRLYSSNLS